MKWNNIITDLNYYLANLYINDGNNSAKRRLLAQSKIPAIQIGWEPVALDTWFNILNKAVTGNKVIALLSAILDEREGNSDDQFLWGALRNLEEENDIIKTVPLKIDEWKVTDLHLETNEKIMGKRSNLLPIGFLENGMEAARAVVRIRINSALGTGFILKNNWLVTNHHVIGTMEDARKAIIEFGYQFRKDQKLSERTSQSLIPEKVTHLNPGASEKDKMFFTNVNEDWTLIKLIENSVLDYGSLNISMQKVEIGDFVNIIQHPMGGPKQIAVYNNIVTYSGADILQYLTDTMPGSSGSPVFNSDWEVVALHHSGGYVKDPNSKLLVNRNQGTPITKIAEFMNLNQLT